MPLRALFRTLWPRAARRLIAFGVGTAKSGTHSLAGLFERHYRAAHEADCSRLIDAILEHAVGRWTDADLRATVEPLEQRVGRETHRLAVRMLGVDESGPGVRELVQATLDLVRGLALANTLTDDRRRRERILDAWADTMDRELGRAA